MKRAILSAVCFLMLTIIVGCKKTNVTKTNTDVSQTTTVPTKTMDKSELNAELSSLLEMEPKQLSIRMSIVSSCIIVITEKNDIKGKFNELFSIIDKEKLLSGLDLIYDATVLLDLSMRCATISIIVDTNDPIQSYSICVSKDGALYLVSGKLKIIKCYHCLTPISDAVINFCRENGAY